MAYLTYNGKYLRYNGKMLTFSVLPPDDVYTDLGALAFDGTGLALGSDTVTIYSTGTWTTSLINTGDTTAWVLGLYPSSGANEESCQVVVSNGYEGFGRSCILRFTVGSATSDVTIQQYGYI